MNTPTNSPPGPRLTTIAITAIVLLRMGIGYHFYREGATKLQSDKSFSEYFLGAAKGPFAPMFQSMIWDKDGLARLDLKTTEAHFKQYRQNARVHFGFNTDQTDAADALVAASMAKLKRIKGDYSEEISTYLKGLERRDRMMADASWNGTATLRDQVAEINADMKKEWMPIQGRIDKTWDGLERGINEIADQTQSRRGYLSLGKTYRGFDSIFIDQVIPFFDLTIGVLLLLGLFTRVAGFAGALFLFSVTLSQWPWAEGAAPVYYQSVEMFAMLVLAAIGAGQFAGLDFFLGACCKRTGPPKTENTNTENES